MINSEDFNEIFRHLSNLPWENKIKEQQIFDIAAKNFKKISAGCSKHHKAIRLIGQSGSGKTTQLLPAATALCREKQIFPLNLAVRNFVELYPNFEELKRQCGAGEIRELTNGFALRCLLVTLVFALEEGFDVLLEVTLLSEEFERFVNKFFTKNHYEVCFFCVAANKSTSDNFILKRMNGENSEKNRIVSKESSDFFFNALSRSLCYYAENFDFRIILWNVFDLLPVFDGPVKDCLPVYFNEIKTNDGNFKDTKVLLEAKIKYLLSHF